jgi:sugar phosphate permease
MADSVVSARIRRVQRTALVLLIVSGSINYVDRATLAVGLPLIRRDLGLSLTESGILLSSFLWTYAFSQLPAGALVDRLGVRLMLSAGLGLWSGAQVLGGLVGSFWQFVVARVLLGVGESPQSPSCARAVSEWFHQRERGLATGIWNCSSSLGTAIAVPLLTFLMLHLGWRWMFATMGLGGIAVAAVIYGLHRDPGQMPLTPEERHYLADDRPPETQRVTWRIWKGLFRFRTTWGMIAGYSGAMYVLWIYNAWLPQYLEIQLHLSIARTGWIASVPFLFGVVGSLIAGRVCDKLLKGGFSPVASRKIPIVASLLGVALFTFLASRTSSAVVAVTCISVSLFLLYSTSCAAWTMATVVAPLHCTASIGSIQNFFGYLGAALAPTVTGIIVARTGSFQPALLVGAAVVAAGAVAHLILVHKPIVGATAPAGGSSENLGPVQAPVTGRAE